jgi:hypothetical protein
LAVQIKPLAMVLELRQTIAEDGHRVGGNAGPANWPSGNSKPHSTHSLARGVRNGFSQFGQRRPSRNNYTTAVWRATPSGRP